MQNWEGTCPKPPGDPELSYLSVASADSPRAPPAPLAEIRPKGGMGLLLSAPKYGPRERVHLVGVLARMCGVTMAD